MEATMDNKSSNGTRSNTGTPVRRSKSHGSAYNNNNNNNNIATSPRPRLPKRERSHDGTFPANFRPTRPNSRDSRQSSLLQKAMTAKPRQVMLVGIALLLLLYTLHNLGRYYASLNFSLASVILQEAKLIRPFGGADETNRREPKFAYAFLLAGIPTEDTSGSAFGNEKFQKQPKDAYRGLLYNVLVSVKILQDSGSKADFVLFVHTASTTFQELPPQDYQLFQQLNVTVKYLPPTPSLVNEFSTLVLEKFRILELVQYDRVLFLDADVMPLCNLDYLMELSYGPQAILQENVILSIGDTPASGAFFVLTPKPGYFPTFLHELSKWSWFWYSFKASLGWGIPFANEEDPSKNDTWKALSGKSGNEWDFDGAQADQGLLLHWTKFIQGSVSIVIGGVIENWVNRTLVVTHANNPLLPYSCLPRNYSETLGHMWYPSEEISQQTSPTGIAPYRDFVQWQANPNRPWHYPKAPPPVLTLDQVMSARKYWFHVIRQLDQELPALQLDFQERNVVTDPMEFSKPEKHGAFREANWKFVSKRRVKSLHPVWSTKVQSLQQWALRTLVNTTRISFPWEPPIWQEKVVASKDKNAPQSAIHKKLWKQCSCSPATISTDPCTGSAPEEWLSRRAPHHLSKQRPLCPQAVRNKLWVVLPFHHIKDQDISSLVCSVACQDYPPDKVSLLLYDDRSSDKTILEGCCKGTDILKFQPAMRSGTTDTRDTFAKTHASRYVTKFRGDDKNETLAPLQLFCVQSSIQLGPEKAQYWALRLLESILEPNDVIVALQADDKLASRNALQEINRAYIDNNAWMTIGSIHEEGGGVNQTISWDGTESATATLGKRMKKASMPFHPRGQDPPWRFGALFTFKAHLLGHLTISDFFFASNTKSWDRPAAVHGLLYRILELSGVDRVAFTPMSYNGTKTQSITDLQASVQKEIVTLEPSVRLELPIHVVLVCWDRIFLLKDQLGWLQEQNITQTRKLHLHLVNNNPTMKTEIESIVTTFRQQQSNVTETRPLEITVVHEEENWHAFSRFLYVQRLRHHEPLDMVVFVDDDQYWPPSFVGALLERHRPKGIVTWYGKVFSQRNTDTGLGDYWSSDVRWSHIVNNTKAEVQTFTYAGPGGSVLDANLWLLDQQLLRLAGDLKDYFEFDDVWVSYILDSLLGWNIRRLATPIPVDIANCNHTLVREVQLSRLPEATANLLLSLHDKIGEQLMSVATYTGTSRQVKTHMFEDLQTRFHWNVFRPQSSLKRESPNPYFSLPSMSVQEAASKPSIHKDDEKRAFICVTGQFDRFELENKIKNLFAPLQRSGYKTDAALVLSNGEASYTNAKKNRVSNKFESFYANFSDAVMDLQQSDIRVLTLNGTYPRLENPPVHHHYLSLMHKSQKKVRTWREQTERAGNHGRIFDSYRRCLEHADEAAKEAGYGERNAQSYYDLFVRIRDDSGLNRPLPSMENVMFDAIPPPPNSVVVTECRNWHGMNDRFAIVSPDVARTYFEHPYNVVAHGLFLDPKVVKNPESFLLNAYTLAKVHVLGHPNLKRVNRVVKLHSGVVKFYRDDKYKAGCPPEDVHMERNFELYGWVL
ncbi:expressed unknown protein [Seminavis robusta]|uniref:Uncharacterized protein n=1 Tax=Seminavis robusta TaxID=568900 RepID=A0A9N8E1J6_9STRA|nr:expressed unknown protein [Seminavis robusta]|eukprot:Sro558_g166300.1 n/a (1573) ;mRNA; r:26531-31339